jgi:hypothetical protein
VFAKQEEQTHMTMAAAAGAAPSRPMTREERQVIIASSVGTVFEWYDFYLAGSLAANISATFFSGPPPSSERSVRAETASGPARAAGFFCPIVIPGAAGDLAATTSQDPA